MNAGERAHWLDPSPPIAVDGEEQAGSRPDLDPDEEAAAEDAPAGEDASESA